MKFTSRRFQTPTTQETLRWKLFLFSLDEREKQWYTHNVGKVNGELDELRDRFYLAFFPISRIASLQKEILDFHQDEKEPQVQPGLGFHS
jgi:hypothetical protein